MRLNSAGQVLNVTVAIDYRGTSSHISETSDGKVLLIATAISGSKMIGFTSVFTSSLDNTNSSLTLQHPNLYSPLDVALNFTIQAVVPVIRDETHQQPSLYQMKIYKIGEGFSSVQQIGLTPGGDPISQRKENRDIGGQAIALIVVSFGFVVFFILFLILCCKTRKLMKNLKEQRDLLEDTANLRNRSQDYIENGQNEEG